MKRIIKKLPIPVSGLMLALAASGNLVLSYGSIYRNIFGSISALIFILLVLKIFLDTKSILEGLNNPVVSSVMPTFSMGMMLLSTYISQYQQGLGLIMWSTGLILHCILIVYFTFKYILKFDIKKVFPSYFIVYVGIAAASVTAPVFNQFAIGQYMFWFGFITYLILLPIVIYRVFRVKGIPEAALPTITIFAAPASLCLAGYMNSFKEKNITLVAFLAVLGLIMTVSVLFYLPRMLRIKFYPSYSAFTFPFVISAIAIKLTNGFLIKANIAVNSLKYIVKFEEVLSIIIVIYVLIRYIAFLFEKNQVQNISGTIKG